MMTGGQLEGSEEWKSLKKKENVSIETGTFPIKLDDYHFQLINVIRAPFILPLWRTELIALRGISMEWKLPSFFTLSTERSLFQGGISEIYYYYATGMPYLVHSGLTRKRFSEN